MLTSREIVVPRPSIPLKLTHAQLLPYIRCHQTMWIAKWRRFDPTYNRDRELERMEQLGGNYQLPPIGLFTFILIATVLMIELFKSEGIENNKANLDAALDQFDTAIYHPQVLAQL